MIRRHTYLVVLGCMLVFNLSVETFAGYDILVAKRPWGGIGSALELHDWETGALLKTVAEDIRVSSNMLYGPDGDIYVADAYGPIYRIDGTTLEFMGQFTVTTGNYNYGMAFGPDGNLYVSGIFQNQIQRFDGVSGQYMDNFVTEIDFPQGMTFGPDGHIYVGSYRQNDVSRYNGQTGEFMDIFASGGGLTDPRGIVFGPDGNLYVSSWATGEVLRYSGSTGQFIDTFASVPHYLGIYGPTDLVFGPDGDLYVCTNEVRHYDGATGAFLDITVTDVYQPNAISFVPEPATLGMLALGGLAVLRRRSPGRRRLVRRRKRGACK